MQSFLTHPGLIDCRRLFLRNFEVDISIGVYEFEKQKTQRVLFNVDLYVPLAQTTPQTDNLDEVLDYDFIRNTVKDRLTQGHVQLQETLCDDLAERLLAHPLVRAVCLSTQKIDVYPDCESVGVEVFRMK